jgi:hypothetical protein
MEITMDYPDACPACPPGVPDAALPLTSVDANDGTLASYECITCGTGWETWFDRYGWPVERTTAPVREAA